VKWSLILTDQHKNDIKKEWNSASKEGHNQDSHLVALVKFMARRAAERDYAEFLEQKSKGVPEP